MEKNIEKWGYNDTLMLIQEVRKFPELWQVRHKDYNNKRITSTLLKTIAIKLDKTFDEVFNKWTSLRLQFIQILKKQAKQMSLTGKCDEIDWPYFNELRFLDKKNNFLIIYDGNSDVEYVDTSPPNALVLPINNHSKRVLPKDQNISTDSPKNKCSDIVSKKPKLDYEDTTFINDHKLFGVFVSQQLALIKSDNVRCQLQIMIQKSIVSMLELDLSLRVQDSKEYLLENLENNEALKGVGVSLSKIMSNNEPNG